MGIDAQEFVNQLLTKEATQIPSDTVKPEHVDLQLPRWFDKEKFNRGRRFFWDHSFSFTVSVAMGITIVLSVPTVLWMTVVSSRSSTVYTAYKRYISTLLHTLSWTENELKPGSTSWKSFLEVRRRHIRAGLAGKLKGIGVISQRDLALSQFGFFGLTMLKPDKFGIKQLRRGDWDAFNHFWRVMGHMVGIEDRYNICFETFEETREVCSILLDRVFTPCLEIVPEYFEHMSRMTLDGPLTVLPLFDAEMTLYYCKNVANVPGYLCTDTERIELQRRLCQQLKGKPIDEGVDSTLLVANHVDGVVRYRKRQLYLRDYDTLDFSPEYKELPYSSKWRLSCALFVFHIYGTYLGRIVINFLFSINLFVVKYFPFPAFLRFGWKASFVNPFVEDPVNSTKPKTNSEYYNDKLAGITQLQ